MLKVVTLLDSFNGLVGNLPVYGESCFTDGRYVGTLDLLDVPYEFPVEVCHGVAPYLENLIVLSLDVQSVKNRWFYAEFQ